MSQSPHEISVRRVETDRAREIAQNPAALILDVRRGEAFRADPRGLPGAVPLVLVPRNQRIPNAPRTTPILVYCLCSGEASSLRAALWLNAAGYRDVAVLRGGLPAWQAAGLETVPLQLESSPVAEDWIGIDESAPPNEALVARHVFLGDGEQPVQRDIAVVFVDMVDSTSLLFRHRPERVLALVQTFMEAVVDTAVRHCGDVHDFAGDGAMLYFAGVGEALPAVFDMRDALEKRREADPELPQARFAITTGPVVIGYIGGRMQRTVGFIGPCVNAAARILPLAEPNGIVATAPVVAQGRHVSPDLASQFREQAEPQWLKGWDHPVPIYGAR